MKKRRIYEKTNPRPKRRKTKGSRETKLHRVYVTYFPDDKYYIGYSAKPEKQYEKYFGSGRLVKEHAGELVKETVAVYKNRNQAKLQEMLMQLEYRNDERCINDMIHIRLRLSHIKDFDPIVWEPSSFTTVQSYCFKKKDSGYYHSIV